MDDYKRGYEFGRFALELAERGKDPSILCKVLYAFTAFIKPWRDPLDETFPLDDRARKLALEVGDHQYVNYCHQQQHVWAVRPRQQPAVNCSRMYDEHWPFVARSKDPFPSKCSQCEELRDLPCRARPHRLIR